MPILQPQKIRQDGRQVKPRPMAKSTEWVGFWSLPLAVAAVPVAAIVFVGGHDRIAASFVLIGTAAMIALIMRVTAPAQT
jgi:lipopolysaccharide export LptBFGC system permease protein LptF